MKRIFGIAFIVVLGGLLLFMTVPASKVVSRASDVTPELVLDKVKVISTQEKHGDELYITLSVRDPQTPTQYFRIPEAPDHWLSEKIDEIKHVNLWSKPIASGQSVIVLVELNEQDATPLDPDDLIGVIRVRLLNDNGTLKVRWELPNQKASVGAQTNAVGVSKSGLQEKFVLENQGGQYEMYLSVKQ